MQLSPHFTLEELVASDYAIRMSIDNTPPRWAIGNLTEVAQALEIVHKLLGGNPIHVSSGYRCLELNRGIGSSDTSSHVQGLAADFTCQVFGSPLTIAKIISQSNLMFDQLIMEGTWVHLAIGGKLRKQILTARFAGGKAHYSLGLPS